MTNPKYHLKSETIKFNSSLESKVDIDIQDPRVDENGFDRTTLLKVCNGEKEIIIKIDWCKFTLSDLDVETLLVEETGLLFFGARFFWGIIDIEKGVLDTLESCMQFWYLERHSEAIVITTELEAISLDLNGDLIHEVPIDPPFESEVFPDKIEYNSIVFGQQILKLRK